MTNQYTSLMRHFFSIFILNLIFGHSTANAINSDIKAWIYQKNNLGYEFTDNFEIKNNIVYVNAFRIKPEQQSIALKKSQSIFKIDTKVQIRCAAGIYIQTVEIAGKKSFLTNCIESNHFKELSKSMIALKALKVESGKN